MSNRQARRDQMRATRQQRAQQTRPTRPGRTPGGPTRGGGGSGLAKYFSSWFVLIVAAVVSPTADIPNMLLFAAPMMVLYVISIFIAWFFGRRRQNDAEAESLID